MSGRHLRLSAVAALATLGLACGGEPPDPPAPAEAPAPPAAEAPARVQPDPAPAPQRAPGLPPGAQAVRGAPVPEAFPSDLPLYGNGEQVAAGAGEDGSTIVILETADVSEAIVPALRASYAEAGWEVQIAEVMDADGLVFARKGDLMAMVAVQNLPDRDKRSIQISTMSAAAPAPPGAPPGIPSPPEP